MAEVVWTDRFAAPLDEARRATLGTALRNRMLRSLFSSRDRRLAWILGAHACVAWLLTILFPAPLLVVLPLVLGVPHVLADVRYLVVRRFERRFRLLLLLGSAALVVVNALSLLGARFDVAGAEVTLGTALVAVTGLTALRSASGDASIARAARGAIVLGAVVVLGSMALREPRKALVMLIHGHNLIAIVAWLWLFRRRARDVLLPLAMVAIGAATLASGAAVTATLHLGVWRAFGTNLLAAADWLAPGVPGALGVGLASSFVFLQSVHYFVWLVLVPADAGSGNGSASFKRRFRDFSRDLGVPVAVASVAIGALVFASGALAPLATKNAYLAVASFHVWLEIAVLVSFAAGGRGRTLTALGPG